MTKRTVREALRKLGNIVRRPSGLQRRSKDAKTQHKTEDWRRMAQEGEFRFHRRNRWRQSAAFMEQTRRLFDYFGFAQNEYDGRTLIDLGAGSKLRSKYFAGANIICIEPLAERFMKEIEWCDLADAQEIYSTPAEVRIAECVNRADLLISINVLDHCYDFELIIQNIAAYLRDGGVAFLSFDKHEGPDKMHPLRLTEEFCERVFAQNGFIVESFTKGCGQILQTYGHGDYCLNYRLKRGATTRWAG